MITINITDKMALLLVQKLRPKENKVWVYLRNKLWRELKKKLKDYQK